MKIYNKQQHADMVNEFLKETTIVDVNVGIDRNVNKNNIPDLSKKIKIDGREYSIIIKDNVCVSLTRDDKKNTGLISDFFSRLCSSGQHAFTPRAHQLKMIINKQLNSNDKIPNKAESTHMSLADLRIGEATNVNNEINNVTNNLLEKLKEFNKDSKNTYPRTERKINRFKNITSRTSTQLHKELSANKISIDGKHIVNAGQYPMDYQIDNHLKMLADNQTSCLVVLTAKGEVDTKDYFLPEYNKSNSELCENDIKLGEMEIDGEKINITADRYKINIENSDKKFITIPVVHVTNWPDKKSVSPEILEKMTNVVKKLIDTTIIHRKSTNTFTDNPGENLPFIHCKAGVGRTGTFIAQYAMLNDPNKNKSLERIIQDTRLSRNENMVQTREQLYTLVEICKSQNRPIFISDEKPQSPVEPIYAKIQKNRSQKMR
ncbi:TPA: dual specificity protein phosphatase family protein [Yersinia enterocolitica]|nr:dual specificity protein phosphatase family protein [Yersinia enterocolitica]HDL7831533.1 dual specificity protein phosphatase family protein [Yersinia enterocolitica]HDL7872197.1 dual specificity protein phosphatase family protein [Yersinia enterocolitica]HDL7884450.1 dual specificity protein phosphatase family protein [Yersinia enterocolitica]HDL7893190.1 dual specificity protein phosphatase family protein [Yersinia enterocolitica]